MEVFMEVQPVMVRKRMEEIISTQTASEAQAQDQQIQNE